MVASHQFLGQARQFVHGDARLHAHDPKRLFQPCQVVVQAEQVSVKGPQLFGHGCARDKTRVGRGDRQRRGGNETAVEISMTSDAPVNAEDRGDCLTVLSRLLDAVEGRIEQNLLEGNRLSLALSFPNRITGLAE